MKKLLLSLLLSSVSFMIASQQDFVSLEEVRLENQEDYDWLKECQGIMKDTVGKCLFLEEMESETLLRRAVAKGRKTIEDARRNIDLRYLSRIEGFKEVPGVAGPGSRVGSRASSRPGSRCGSRSSSRRNSPSLHSREMGVDTRARNGSSDSSGSDSEKNRPALRQVQIASPVSAARAIDDKPGVGTDSLEKHGLAPRVSPPKPSSSESSILISRSPLLGLRAIDPSKQHDLPLAPIRRVASLLTIGGTNSDLSQAHGRPRHNSLGETHLPRPRHNSLGETHLHPSLVPFLGREISGSGSKSKPSSRSTSPQRGAGGSGPSSRVPQDKLPVSARALNF